MTLISLNYITNNKLYEEGFAMKVIGKKIIVVILVLSMLISVSGCAKKEIKTEDKSNSKTSEKNENEKNKTNETSTTLVPMTISIGVWDIDKAITQNDPVLKLIEEKLNIKIEPKAVSWSDYGEKFKLWAASGELPDVFADTVLNSEAYEGWISQGVIRSLPRDLSKFPNVSAVLSTPDVQALQRDGDFYMIPRMTYPSPDMWTLDRGVLMRKDWLDTLGLEIPTTFEEYKMVLKAFAEQDLDGNGKKDTLGIVVQSAGLIPSFFLGSVPQVANSSWIEEDGQWIPSFYSRNMIKGIKQVKELYEDGLLDPDFALMKDKQGSEKYAQGQAGALITQVTARELKAISNLWDKYNHDIAFEDTIALAPFWADEQGVMHSFVETTYWSESYIRGDVDDAKMERILMLYDYLLSDEFMEIRQYGLEGIDYEKTGDDYTILRNTDTILSDTYPFLKIDYLAAWAQHTLFYDNKSNRSIYGEGIINAQTEFVEYCKENLVPTKVNFTVNATVTPAKTKLSAISITDSIVKAVLGDGDVEAGWSKIREEFKNYGVEDAIKEVNEKVRQ